MAHEDGGGPAEDAAEVVASASDLDPAPAEEADDRHPLSVLLGGPWGAIESMAPTVLFVLAYFAASGFSSSVQIWVAAAVALGAAAILAGIKVARREKPVRVLSGLLGVAVAALFAAYSGRTPTASSRSGSSPTSSARSRSRCPSSSRGRSWA